MLDMLVSGGTIVSPRGRVRADLGVKNGRVVSVGEDLGEAREHVDAAGLHVLPGLIDVHVHFRDPGMTAKEDFGSGSTAAAVGGVTTVFDMPNTDPPVSTAERWRAKYEVVAPKARVDFGLYGVVTQDNGAELTAMADEGAMGFKLFMGQTTGDNPCPDDGVIFAAFRTAATLGLTIGAHAENNAVLQLLKRELRAAGRTDPRAHLESRPAFIEAEAVSRAATLAAAAGNHLHIHHLSTREGLQRVVQARALGTRISCEALIGHLLLDDAAYESQGNLVQLNPPIRPAEHVQALWEGIAARTIDCIATDHAPHTGEEQACTDVWSAVGGFIGVETLLPLLLTQVAAGRLELEQLVQLTSAGPAAIYGASPQKGSLDLGADADFVLVDTQRTAVISGQQLHSAHPVTPYEGWQATGMPVATYLRGQCVARDGVPVGDPRGRLVKPRRVHRATA
ncbi:MULTISPECIES: dihydroorotase [unclassified Modestobacter]|uniref:dihydroorotase n=1 Tax=unclassified Modestobacter TaxID=2643866 RepID=UPI0022AB32BA|nr:MULTISPECIES: dihydroorotase family protein [unclassified Modestobacter]MCZ2825032.1 dihydroorotase family protein [Modestobacter sp. VKM Ac-2981]MCZ2854465.1 dihydroorotase family protein [Modestobacter sp. VKM Ac-2982]